MNYNTELQLKNGARTVGGIIGVLLLALAMMVAALFIVAAFAVVLAAGMEKWEQSGSTTAILDSLTDESSREFMTIEEDAWDNKRRVKIESTKEMVSVELRSAGPDGVFDTEDDTKTSESRLRKIK